jgi:cell shape-determining protein MreC
MKKLKFFPYIFLALFLLFILSLSKNNIDRCRRIAISSISPSWRSINKVCEKTSIFNLNEKDIVKMEKVFLENTMLKNQIGGIYEWLFFENRIEDQMEKFKALNDKKIENFYLKEFFQRRAEEIKEILKLEYQALPAKVIFRDPSSWSSSLWINVGEKNNEDLSQLIIAKNSPVILGQNLIGIVEYVGYNYSRIRLITDAGLIPSVRAIRGSQQDKSLLNIIHSLRDHVLARENLFSTSEEKEKFLNTLYQMTKKLSDDKEEKYLAKGELYGSSQPLWRSRGITLKGMGFNYDYPDEEGSIRSLKSKEVVEENILNIKTEPLLEVGDLLVTTGMDGVFPKGLNVAIVSKVHDLNDGDYAYEIEAKPTAANLNELEVVLVLPPVGFEMKE